MALRIELKPFERMIVNGASIRNGSKRATFVIETQSRILREKDIITESQANTPCKRLYVTLEHIYLADDPKKAEQAFMEIANDVMKAAPSTKPFILSIYLCLQEEKFFHAIKECRKLIGHETALLEGLIGSLNEPDEHRH